MTSIGSAHGAQNRGYQWPLQAWEPDGGVPFRARAQVSRGLGSRPRVGVLVAVCPSGGDYKAALSELC